MNVSLRQLEYFAAVADECSFGRAAKTCAVTQPGLSAQLRQLEEHLGVRLFERDRRQVLITRAGEALLPRARRVLLEARELEEAARGHAEPLCGELRLGVIPTLAPYLLPRALPLVRERYPKLRLLLREEQTGALVELLWSGELDLLLLALEAPLEGLETHALFDDSFLLAVPPGHRLAKRRQIGEAELAAESVLLLEDGHCLRNQALAICGGAGASEVGDVRATSLCTLVQMVAGGEGVTLLPEIAAAIEASGDALKLLSFVKPPPSRTIGLAWRPSSACAEEFRSLGLVIEASRASAPGRRPRRDAGQG